MVYGHRASDDHVGGGLMRCQYVEIGEAENGRRLCQCLECGHQRASKYSPEQIHRICPALPANQVEADKSCIHRGQQIGERTCDQCGVRGQVLPVYHCELLQSECTWNWWTNDTRKRRADGLTICLTCPSRERADGSKPVAEVLANDPASSQRSRQ